MLIFLVGFMGSGKSTIGKKLANSLFYEFVDLDDFIEEKYQTTIREIMENYGEDDFRKKENLAISEMVKSKKNLIISTGGGAPCHYNNMNLMNEHGVTIYLKADEGTLVNRISNSKTDRPLIKSKDPNEMKEFIAELLGKRKKYYEQSKIVLNTINLKVADVIKELETILN